MTRLQPPGPEKVAAATKRIKDTGRLTITDLYVLTASMWFLCEEQGLLDDPRCDLVREATRAVVDTTADAFEAETGRRGSYLELLAWQAAKDEEAERVDHEGFRRPAGRARKEDRGGAWPVQCAASIHDARPR